MDVEATLTEGHEMVKVISAKSINSEYGIYHNHNRLNTINTASSHNNGTATTKNMTKYIKNIVCPGPDV